MAQTESAQCLMDAVDKSFTMYMRCLIRYWLAWIQGRPIKGSDVETALHLAGSGQHKVLHETICEILEYESP